MNAFEMFDALGLGSTIARQYDEMQRRTQQYADAQRLTRQYDEAQRLMQQYAEMDRLLVQQYAEMDQLAQQCLRPVEDSWKAMKQCREQFDVAEKIRQSLCAGIDSFVQDEARRAEDLARSFQSLIDLEALDLRMPEIPSMPHIPMRANFDSPTPEPREVASKPKRPARFWTGDEDGDGGSSTPKRSPGFVRKDDDKE